MDNTNNLSPKQGIRRPWYGTLLGIGCILDLVAIGLMLIVVIVMVASGGSMFGEMIQNIALPVSGSEMLVGMSSMGIIMLIPLALIFVLRFFITRGIFKGQKWSIILSIIFVVLGLVSTIYSSMFVVMALYALILVLLILCLRHPYYSKKK